jgi:7-cyano-7-deazaguanine reductase
MAHRPDTLAHAPLGRDSAYPEQYDAGLLYPIPRAANRVPLGIEEGALPFVGEDEWHAFEAYCGRGALSLASSLAQSD